MNEVGGCIVPNASAPKPQCDIAQAGGLYPGKTNINRFRFHVQAMLCDAGGMRPQKLIAPRRPVTTDDVDFSVRVTAGSRQEGQKVKYARIIVVNFARAMVAQKRIQFRKRLGDVLGATPVDHIYMLTGVGVKEPKVAFVG